MGKTAPRSFRFYIPLHGSGGLGRVSFNSNWVLQINDTVLKTFWKVLGYFGVVSATVATLFGIFKYFDSLSDNVSSIQEDVEMISVEQSWIAEDIENMKDTLEFLGTQQQKASEDIETLNWGLHHINDFDPEQFEEIMNELLKKNFGDNWTPSLIQPFQLNNQTALEEESYPSTEEKWNSSQ